MKSEVVLPDAVQAHMPRFTGLSHICIFVDNLYEGCRYYERLLGAVPDHYLPHWKNEGFFQAAGFVEEAKKAGVPDTAWFSEKQGLTSHVLSNIQKGDILWVKGSHGMALETLVEAIYQQA